MRHVIILFCDQRHLQASSFTHFDKSEDYGLGFIKRLKVL